MVGAPQKLGQYPKSGAVAIAEPTRIEEEIAIKSQAICRDSAEESITIYEAANCGPTEKLKNGLQINHRWKWIVLLAIHTVSQWLQDTHRLGWSRFGA